MHQIHAFHVQSDSGLTGVSSSNFCLYQSSLKVLYRGTSPAYSNSGEKVD